jgi:hypothetical protein
MAAILNGSPVSPKPGIHWMLQDAFIATFAAYKNQAWRTLKNSKRTTICRSKVRQKRPAARLKNV